MAVCNTINCFLSDIYDISKLFFLINNGAMSMSVNIEIWIKLLLSYDKNFLKDYYQVIGLKIWKLLPVLKSAVEDWQFICPHQLEQSLCAHTHDKSEQYKPLLNIRLT